MQNMSDYSEPQRLSEKTWNPKRTHSGHFIAGLRSTRLIALNHTSECPHFREMSKMYEIIGFKAALTLLSHRDPTKKTTSHQ